MRLSVARRSIQALATDPFGNVYAAGSTAGWFFNPATTDVFLAKVTADGAVVWTTRLGGSNQDQLAAKAADYQGNPYVTGTTHSTDFPTTLPPIGVPGQQALFVTKYSTGGTLLWSVRLGGSAPNSASALAVDSADSVYVTEGTHSTDFPITPGVLDGNLTTASLGSAKQ